MFVSAGVMLCIAACSDATDTTVQPAADDSWEVDSSPEQSDAIDVPGPPEASVTPTHLAWDHLAAVKTIQVTNSGGSELVIERVRFTGAPDFALTLNGVEHWPGPKPLEFTADKWGRLVVPAGKTTDFRTTFFPFSVGRPTAEVVFETNDPVHPNLTVTLAAETVELASNVSPTMVHFGPGQVGTESARQLEFRAIEGDGPYVVTDIRLKPGSNSSFSLNFGGFNTGPTEAVPLRLEGMESAIVSVVYRRIYPSQLGPPGEYLPDTAVIEITSNQDESPLELDVTGITLTDLGPVPVVEVAEGQFVVVGTTLHLSGDQSFGPWGITSYRWSVDQPMGSQSQFLPNETFPNPTFKVDVAGTYTFDLTVFGADGTESWQQWNLKVIVEPDDAIRVELLWHTPADIDETDVGLGAGSDLDLHVVHDANASLTNDPNEPPDPWFHELFDCFWFNPNPNWGLVDAAVDDPHLTLADNDGAGPESFRLEQPESTTYRIGVHYWDDHNYGKSLATVQVYLQWNLVYEVSGVELQPGDLWDVGTIEWPSAVFTPVVENAMGSPGYAITPNYDHPLTGPAGP